MGRKNKKIGIYCIENILNNKKYIGQSIDIVGRFCNHKNELEYEKHNNDYLQYAYDKYGKENFKFYIIQEFECFDEEKLNLMEIYWISYFNSFCKDGGGYNLTRGGEGVHGYIHSDERRIKIGKNTPKRFGKDNSNFGRKVSQEEKNSLSFQLSREKSPVFGVKYDDRTSQYYGVSKHIHKQTKNGVAYIYEYWVAKLRVDKTEHHIGNFKNEEDAGKAYDNFVIKNNLKNPLNFGENK